MLLAPSWFMAFGRRPKVARSLLDTLLFADGSVERCGSRSRDLRRAKPHGLQVERSPASCARKTGARLRTRGNRNMLKTGRETCRERMCEYVKVWVGGGTNKKKTD